jgi:hypothetical protein
LRKQNNNATATNIDPRVVTPEREKAWQQRRTSLLDTCVEQCKERGETPTQHGMGVFPLERMKEATAHVVGSNGPSPDAEQKALPLGAPEHSRVPLALQPPPASAWFFPPGVEGLT